jgi:hypothetical protein
MVLTNSIPSIMMQYLEKLFGLSQAKEAVSLYEVKQYAAQGLQNTWYTDSIEETAHGYTFIDSQSGNAIFVSGHVKITGFTPENAFAIKATANGSTAATDPSTTATSPATATGTATATS